MVHYAFFVAAILLCSAAAWIDWRTGQIPNWLNASGAGVALCGHLVFGYVREGANGLLWGAGFSLAGGIANIIVPYLMYRLSPKAIGGGDVKLLFAVGMLLGPMLGIECEFYGFVVAALYYPARLAYRGSLFSSIGNLGKVAASMFSHKRQQLDTELMLELRFAPALLVGTLVCLTSQLLF